VKILVLGASGRLGRHIVGGLLSRGHRVRAFIHTDNALTSHMQLELFRGDVHDGAKVGNSVHGVDAVVSALGSAAAPLKDVASSAMQHVIPAMTASSIRRIVSVTGSAAWRDHERESPHPYLRARRDQLMRVIPELVIDGEIHIRMLENSGLDWTVIRAPLMQGEPTSSYVLSLEPPLPQTISSYVAITTAVMDQLTADEWIGRRHSRDNNARQLFAAWRGSPAVRYLPTPRHDASSLRLQLAPRMTEHHPYYDNELLLSRSCVVARRKQWIRQYLAHPTRFERVASIFGAPLLISPILELWCEWPGANRHSSRNWILKGVVFTKTRAAAEVRGFRKSRFL
jgi:putative NADH-flavin reductase